MKFLGKKCMLKAEIKVKMFPGGIGNPMTKWELLLWTFCM